MNIEFDPWLAGVVGFPVYRVELSAHLARTQIASSLPGALLGKCRDGFFHCKLSVENTRQLAALEDCGFRVVDVNVSFSRRPDHRRGDGSAGPVTPIVVAPVTSEESDAVIELAERCFTFSRFHLDPLIPNETANRINGAWVEDYVTGRRGVLLDGAYIDDQLVGFNAILEIERARGKVLVIDLIGVHPENQGQGVGAALVDHFLEWSVGRCCEVSVGTQVANVPAVRLYEKKGFRLSGARFVLHAHLSDGEILRTDDRIEVRKS